MTYRKTLSFIITVPGRGKENKTQSQDVHGLLCKRKRTEAGHTIRCIQYCEECPEKPRLCLGECF